MSSSIGIETQQMMDENLPLKERLETMLQTIVPPLTSQCCIFRVPQGLRKIKESAYTPQVISVGPFHCNSSNDELRFMQNQKVRYLNHVLQVCNVNLDSLLTSIRIWEERVRQSYGEHVTWLNSDEFVMMVLLDGVFIVEYFRRNCLLELRDENDKALIDRKKLWASILFDLILLENQLPFFVLESLYKLVYPTESSRDTFLEMSCHVFSVFNMHKTKVPEVIFLHFTDLMRTFQVAHSSFKLDPIVNNNQTDKQHISIYSAKELKESGIKFKASSSKCLFDIQFIANEGLLLIPKLDIYDGKETLLRNMMALEQYLYMDERYVCDCVYLLDTLIDTSKDVELLVRKGIIENRLGDHSEVAALFNNLNREIVYYPSKYYFSKLNQDLDKYYKKPQHKWKASLKRDYFSSPWKIASVIATVILLVLTLIQTICSIIQFLPHKPK